MVFDALGGSVSPGSSDRLPYNHEMTRDVVFPSGLSDVTDRETYTASSTIPMPIVYSDASNVATVPSIVVFTFVT